MARKGMTKDEYVDYILLTLGNSIVSVEVENDIPKIVDMAFNELRNYITDVETMTLPYSNKISLAGKHVNNVVYVMRGTNTMGYYGGATLLQSIYSNNYPVSSSSLNQYASYLLYQQNKAALATDLDFHYDKRNEDLYVYCYQAVPATITLVFTRDYDTVDEIIEPFWQNLLKRLSVAMTKEILGRVRGKYQLNSATYSLDGDKLLAEAQTELAEIRAYLNDNSDLLLPID